MKAKTQKFEAVKFMRAKRDELSQLRSENPGEYMRKLAEIRKKYPAKFANRKRSGA